MKKVLLAILIAFTVAVLVPSGVDATTTMPTTLDAAKQSPSNAPRPPITIPMGRNSKTSQAITAQVISTEGGALVSNVPGGATYWSEDSVNALLSATKVSGTELQAIDDKLATIDSAVDATATGIQIANVELTGIGVSADATATGIQTANVVLATIDAAVDASATGIEKANVELTGIGVSADACSTGITASAASLAKIDAATAASATGIEAVRAALAGAVQASTFTTGTGFVAAATADNITLWAAGSGATTIKGIMAWVNGSSTDYLDFSVSATGGSVAGIAAGDKFRVQANEPVLIDRLNWAVVLANAGTVIYGKVSSPNLAGGFKVLY